MLGFLKLIDRKKAVTIFTLGLISGIINFLFLGFINLMIGLIMRGKDTSDVNYVILFCSLLLTFIWSRRSLSLIIIKFSQQIFWTLRSQILQTILKANYYQFSKRKDQIHTALTADIGVLTNFSLSIIQFLSSLIMTIGSFTYMGMQSLKLMWITLAVAITGTIFYWIGVHFNKKKFLRSRELENVFMRSFLDILSGFKEIYMNPKIGQDIFNRRIRNISSECFKNNTDALSGFLNIQIIGEVLFYALIGFTLIYNSIFINESPKSIVNFIFILLYLLSSINSLMVIIPTFVQARIASDKIQKLKKELNNERFQNYIENKGISIAEFKSLNIFDLKFNYKNDEGQKHFGIGPVNLTLNKGEIVFIYGGNGSGKTTMMNAILGILRSDSGTIIFNEVELNDDNYNDYRTLFSVVFNDFYLFEELYGFDIIPENEINEYLEMFELAEKVSFKDNTFSTNNLSTGQRKRIGLIQVLIRSTPIIVLDEWAADQDPAFRRKFYTQIVPELRNRGFSIIAITHDDAYYNMSDKLYKMEGGQLTLLSPEYSRKELVI
jgi:putative ATP-binding cassette transporter